jgi:hemerythrin-like domain-containing protein
MRPTDILRQEHQVILTVLDAAEREARAVMAGAPVDAGRLERFVDFIRTFADHCHHAKEEDLLFVRMGQRGFPAEVGPIAVMLHEHEVGRALVKAVADNATAAASGDAAARQTVAESLSSYATLLRNHIYKEDNILYPMADQAFTDEDQSVLAADFERVEREDIGEGVHERYEALARELAGR